MKSEPATSALVAARDVVNALLPLFTETRLERNLSLRAVSVQLGLGVATLSEWEAGKREPSLGSVRTIVSWLAEGAQGTAAPSLEDELSARQLAVLQQLRFHADYGQAWLQLQPGGFGLLLPQADRRFGYAGLHRRQTMRALQNVGLVSIAGAVEQLPQYDSAGYIAGFSPVNVGHRINLNLNRERDTTHDQPTAEPLALQEVLPVPGDPLDPFVSAG